jgi:hypothetical protein
MRKVAKSARNTAAHFQMDVAILGRITPPTASLIGVFSLDVLDSELLRGNTARTMRVPLTKFVSTKATSMGNTALVIPAVMRTAV